MEREVTKETTAGEEDTTEAPEAGASLVLGSASAHLPQQCDARNLQGHRLTWAMPFRLL